MTNHDVINDLESAALAAARKALANERSATLVSVRETQALALAFVALVAGQAMSDDDVLRAAERILGPKPKGAKND